MVTFRKRRHGLTDTCDIICVDEDIPIRPDSLSDFVRTILQIDVKLDDALLEMEKQKAFFSFLGA